jgi:uncharacterized membrane-anchored protein YjiN (DUF445 family)
MIPDEATMESRLKRMQWFATGLLALMAVIFIVTSLTRDEWPLLGLLWAFSEAALIGGLADWFAVTALFRRPLGLPIPHTAIVPNRKDEIGRSLARFVAEHFLVRSVLEAEIGRLDLAQSFGRWLRRPDNAASLTRDLSRALGWLLSNEGGGPLRQAAKDSLRESLTSLPMRQLLAALIDVFASGPHAQELVDGLVRFSREQLERNKPMIRERIRDRSPWWLPRFVDEEIFDQLVGELERILTEVGDEMDHPARQALLERLRHLQDAIANDAALLDRTTALRDDFLNHPAVTGFGRDVAAHTHAFVIEALDDPESSLRQGMEQELARLGNSLAENGAIADRVNAWLTDIMIYLVETYREPISSVISTTIAQWDAESTSRRIELHIGRDLQFIRINGTLVGGLVGLVLYVSWTSTVG